MQMGADTAGRCSDDAPGQAEEAENETKTEGLTQRVAQLLLAERLAGNELLLDREVLEEVVQARILRTRQETPTQCERGAEWSRTGQHSSWPAQGSHQHATRSGTRNAAQRRNTTAVESKEVGGIRQN